MKLLTLSNSPLDPAFGSGYVICGFAEGLRARGHEVELVGPPAYEPFFGARRAIRHRQAWGMWRYLCRALARQHYEVVELWGAEGWLAVRQLTRQRQRPLLIARSNGLEPHAAERLGPRRLLELDPTPCHHHAFRAADALVVVSDFDRTYGLARGYAGGRVVTIENPLPPSFLGQPVSFPREPLLLWCGAWLERKGIDQVKAELPALLARHPAWRLVLAGVGSDFEARALFPPALLPRIEVVPTAARETALRNLYHRAAILLVPSLYESFGLVTAEAMACGAAVVASPVGFAAGLRDGEEALLVGTAAHPTLTAGLERLMGDEALRRRLAEGGYRRVQGLGWEGATSRLEALYHELAAREVRA